MQTVKSGDTVKVHYKGTLTDGSLFDSSEGREPLQFQVGNQQVIQGFDEGVIGMQVGEKKSVHIPVDQAYGPSKDDMIVEFDKKNFPPEMAPEVGMQLNMTDQEGHVIPVVIREIKDDSIVLDANHPLAGEDLNFDIELVEIVGAKPLIIMP